ncbi:MAG: alpha/beta hydrolase [Chloroflexi bacterium]|nr:alpha/beta hydrolase [Chloroflexota bacterium]
MVLIHGAANSAVAWTYWQSELATRGWASHAVDLRGHGKSVPFDLSETSMSDYVSDVASVASQLREPPVLVGWSMGGLVAMMAASAEIGVACVALAPSLPVREINPIIRLRKGVFGPEEYGVVPTSPEERSSMPDLDDEERAVALASCGNESRYARDERKRGIVIESLPCPLLTVRGSEDTQWPKEKYKNLWLDSDQVEIQGASHWGLVLNRRAVAQTVPKIIEWLSSKSLAEV